MKKVETKQMNVKLPAPLLRRFARAVEQDRTTASEIVREHIKQWLKNRLAERKARTAEIASKTSSQSSVE